MSQPQFKNLTAPSRGERITIQNGKLTVPNNPVIPYIEGDGIGVDITPVMIKVIDAAVAKAYGEQKKIHWMEVYAGEKSTRLYGPDGTLYAHGVGGLVRAGQNLAVLLTDVEPPQVRP